METLKEVLEKKDMVRDVKARRVANAAPGMVCGITAEEIEKNGVTIEKLESLSVPVFQYGGQVTIHGVFPDTVGNMKVAGYRSVFKNGNGSLGVRYAAIDAAKKTRLSRLSLFKAKDGFYVGTDSRGCHASKVFHQKQEALDCYRSIPDLYIGTKQVGVDMFGRFHVILDIGAVYEKDFAALAETLLKKSVAELEKAEREEEDRRKQERERWDKEAEIARANRKILEAELLAKSATIKEELKKIYPSASVLENGVFATPCMSLINPANRGVLVFKITKGSFGRFFCAQGIVPDAASVGAFIPKGEGKIVSDLIKARFSKGLVYKVS